ncbi:MAG TPA: hypothetical protein PKA41_06820 [Verrucomicrobiota bacterium]|nr:hypothetical protein [Verrucomicrobiota bacterium]
MAKLLTGLCLFASLHFMLHRCFIRISALSLVVGISMVTVHADTFDSRVLLTDEFNSLPPGMFSAGVTGADTEYHYHPEAGPKGNWAVSCFNFRSEGSQRAWRVIGEAGRQAMLQAHLSTTNERSYTHPILVAGDELWRDYRVTVQFTPQLAEAKSGVLFRYQNDRCYYFFGVEDGDVVLKRVQHEKAFHVANETLLDKRELNWQPGDLLTATITVRGDRIKAELERHSTVSPHPDPLPQNRSAAVSVTTSRSSPPNAATGFQHSRAPIQAEGKRNLPTRVIIETNDDYFPGGKIALLADVPTVFHSVRVTTSRAAEKDYLKRKADREKELAALEAANPKMVLWKKIRTPGFGVGRNLRFGDLNGDGQVDILIGQVRHHGPKDRNSELSCLTAITLDGEKLWQIGEPNPWNDNLTSDVAFQIHDLDGDGRNEVIYCMNQELIVADGATGKTKFKTPTPETPANNKPPYNRFPRILGDCLFFCDLSGKGRNSDILIKDRYRYVWALNEKLELLWQAECNTGHYPFALDVDGDGRDEIAIGYSLFDHDGKLLWTLEEQIKDHADGVALVKFGAGPDAPLLYFCAASDEGAFFADLKGNILKHDRIGHVQNPAIADFRPDLPGLETVTINFWGNQGIVHVFDSNMEIIHASEPCQHGSMMLPINWTGLPGEYFVLSANVAEGGLFDGRGRRVVRFPSDGHPELCNAVLDITGDCRDEIVVWDPWEIWIYTQSDNPKPGKLYKPGRNSLSNYSNYQTTVSLPGWSE